MHVVSMTFALECQLGKYHIPNRLGRQGGWNNDRVSVPVKMPGVHSRVSVLAKLPGVVARVGVPVELPGVVDRVGWLGLPDWTWLLLFGRKCCILDFEITQAAKFR